MSDLDVQVGQVWRSADHRNQNRPWLLIVAVSDSYVVAQRYLDKALTLPKGTAVPVTRKAWEEPAYVKVCDAGETP